MARFRHNSLSLLSETLAAILRCEKKGKQATVGQVGKHLVNIHISRVLLQHTIDDLYSWGLIRKEKFAWRSNVQSTHYAIERHFLAWRQSLAMIAYNADLACYFPEEMETLQEVFKHEPA